jgi:hypothetical protein
MRQYLMNNDEKRGMENSIPKGIREKIAVRQ